MMKKILIFLVIALCMVISFATGFRANDWYYNDDSLYEANEFKREYIYHLDNAQMILDSIIDSHADDGVCDQLIDELYMTDYFYHIHKIDSLAQL